MHLFWMIFLYMYVCARVSRVLFSMNFEWGNRHEANDDDDLYNSSVDLHPTYCSFLGTHVFRLSFFLSIRILQPISTSALILYRKLFKIPWLLLINIDVYCTLHMYQCVFFTINFVLTSKLLIKRRKQWENKGKTRII